MKKNYNLYVLLTKTPLKTGKFIRRITGYEYNHCSVSFDRNFNSLYSFTRKYKSATFYACLVNESSLRYKENTKVKIFKIPINYKTYKRLKNYLSDLISHENDYIYNYLSIITYPFKKKVKIKKCYTCCEFTVEILKKFCKITEFTKKDYYSVKEVAEFLNKYLLYEGTFKVENTSWGKDKYLEKINFFYKNYKVTTIFVKLIKRYLAGLIKSE